MTIFKCKMCDGSLEINNNESVATCEYCGTQQTLPKIDDEKKLALFNRANNLRFKSEFDKAAGIYESIIAEFPDEAEAYWGLVLCKYGIEYVDDKDGSKIPTCHRTLPTSIMDDEDFEQACEYADITAKNLYRDEAKAVDKIQKKILNIALNEEPYDVFICYKEADDITGARTEDSSIAQDIYTQLLKDGYRVFFSRVSLREVAGTEYEPYIYAALSSAKIMLAIGTKHDYYDAVWVKNEWSRFISMMGDDSSKVLIPCFKNMDAYDMPKEFKNMQALDMGDVTFFGSLTENIERIIDKTSGRAQKETIILNNDNVDVAPLLERGFLILEDKDWNKADELFEAVLNKDPKNGNAYLGKLLADLEVSRIEDLSSFYTTFSGNNHYEKIMRFGDSELKENIKKCNDIIARRLEEARKKDLYENALEMMEHATTEEMFENAGYMFQEVKDYADAKEKSDECFEKGEIARKDAILFDAKERMRGDNTLNYESAIVLFESIPGWKDADEQILACKAKIAELEAKAEAERIENERRAEEKRKQTELAQKEIEARAKKNKKLAMIITPIVAVVIVLIIILNTVIIPNNKYNDAVALMEAGKYEEANEIFEVLGDYKDSKEKIHTHEYAEKVLIEPQCDTRGSKEFSCWCGKKVVEDIPCTEHNYSFVFNEMECVCGETKPIGVGDVITFGSYEQDNNTSNGKEEISWIVLASSGNEYLLISEYCLDNRQYHSEWYNTWTEWSDCDLRGWLNGTFYDNAFSSDEKGRILSTQTEYYTTDKVYILSMSEAQTYFSDNSSRKSNATQYVIGKNEFYAEYSSWWLRTAGYAFDATVTVAVDEDGSIFDGGFSPNASDVLVRPVIRIDLNKTINP